MKIGSKIRGPRLGTKLTLLGLALLVLPYFSYLQLVEMERLLIQGQSHAQLLTAEGISTLFNGREHLFADLPVNPKDYESLRAHPIESPVRLDGVPTEWGDVETRVLSFGGDGAGPRPDGAFDLVAGERGGDLYVHMDIRDDRQIFRDPRYLRLDNADHVRLSFIRPDGEEGRAAITLQEPGVTTTYWMQPDWAFAETGAPETRIKGYVTASAAGYRLEFRMPLALLGSRRYFGLSFVDVDDPEARAIRAITQTLPTAGKEGFNLAVYRSPEVLEIIEGLGYSGARIQVIDPQHRVRADTGSYQTGPAPDAERDWTLQVRAWFREIRLWVQDLTGTPDATAADSEALPEAAITAALAGEPIATRRLVDDGVEIIVAAHPIVSKDAVLGAVVVEQDIDHILTFQREALEQVMVVAVSCLLAVFLAMVAFSGRLAWRIRNLRREAARAIDRYGRLRKQSLDAERRAGDEIGDLSRSISTMLTRLHQHNSFLEKMPRTLRHEINNPLNVLATSLESLADRVEERDEKYLNSAKRGVLRIGAIVQNLADAANLEESLVADDFEVVDIGKLLGDYVNNFRLSEKRHPIVFRGMAEAVYARVADYRIEQMLDKIVDNAIDFHHADSPIKVQLDKERDFLRITVANRGPTLPETREESLFESMVSHRGPHSRMHFGLGLYVVRAIAEHHGGTVRALNLVDGSGVAIMVELPLSSDAAAPVRADERHRSTPRGHDGEEVKGNAQTLRTG